MDEEKTIEPDGTAVSEEKQEGAETAPNPAPQSVEEEEETAVAVPANPEVCAIKLANDDYLLVTWQNTGMYKGWLPAVPIRYVAPDLTYSGSKMPLSLWRTVQAFFRWAYAKHKAEAQVRIFHKEETGDWKVLVLKQEVSGASTKEIETEESRKTKVNALTALGYHPIGTIHSHGSMSAFQSSTDFNDEEKQPGVHITMGGMDNAEMSLHGRVSLRGLLYPICWDQWFDSTEEILKTNPPATTTFPLEWKPLVTKYMYVAPKQTYHYGSHGHWENGTFVFTPSKYSGGSSDEYGNDLDTTGERIGAVSSGETRVWDAEPSAEKIMSRFTANEQADIRFMMDSILEYVYNLFPGDLKDEAKLTSMADVMMMRLMSLRALLRDVQLLDSQWEGAELSICGLIAHLCDTAKTAAEWDSYQEAIRLIWSGSKADLKAIIRHVADMGAPDLDVTEESLCVACRGSGLDASETTECPLCGGMGIREIAVPGSIEPPKLEATDEKCITCDGTGLNSKKTHRCPICKGSGLQRNTPAYVPPELKVVNGGA